MWAMLPDSFLSIVADHDPKRQKTLTVRSRQKGDIENMFPRARVYHTPERDYAYRAYIPRAVVAEAIHDHIMGITYTNFKNTVRDQARHDAYLEVWNTMFRWGRGLFRRKPVHDKSWLDDYENDVMNDISRDKIGKVIR